MSHLTDDQLELILAGETDPPEHATTCESCRAKLEDHNALRSRLRSAFSGVCASDELRQLVSEKIRANVRTEPKPASVAPSPRSRILRLRLPTMAAAAAIVLIGVGAVIYVVGPSAATAAQRELVAIHQHNLNTHGEFFVEDDPVKLADYFRNKLGFIPVLPRLGAGMAIRGCCVRHFRGKIVGSYVVETPHKPISIIVVTDEPRAIGATREIRRGDHTYGTGSFARCNMVTARLGDYTYCSVGELPIDLLTEVLDRLMLNSD